MIVNGTIPDNYKAQMIVNGVTDSLTGVSRAELSTCPFTTIYPLTTMVPTDLLANKTITVHP